MAFSPHLLGTTPLAHAAKQPAAQVKSGEKAAGIDWRNSAAVQALRRVLSRDALGHLRRYALTHSMGYGSRDLIHWIAGVYYAREAGRDEAWVVAASKPRRNFECHACYPKLSILVYAQVGPNRWQLIGQGYDTFEGSVGWGKAPDAKEMALVHIAEQKVALAVISGYTNMGWSEEYYGLYRVEGNRGREIFLTTTQSDNLAAASTPITDWKSRLRFVPVAGRPWYDIQIRRQGKLEGRAIDYMVIYRYKDGIYRPEERDWVMQNR